MSMNATNTAVQDVLREEEERRTNERRRDMALMLSHDWSRRFLYRLIFDECEWGEQVFDPAIRDGVNAAEHMAFKDGKRSVGIALVGEAQSVSREGWVTMIEEQLAQADADAARRKREIESAQRETES